MITLDRFTDALSLQQFRAEILKGFAITSKQEIIMQVTVHCGRVGNIPGSYSVSLGTDLNPGMYSVGFTAALSC
jgi:hypothetical protein